MLIGPHLRQSIRVRVSLFVAPLALPLLADVLPEELDGELRLSLLQEFPPIGGDDVFRVASDVVEAFVFQFGSEIHVADRQHLTDIGGGQVGRKSVLTKFA